MVSLCYHSISLFNQPHHPLLLNHHYQHRRPASPFIFHHPRATVSTITCTNKNTSLTPNPNQNQNELQRTLFPGGYKRSEIKIPNIALQLNPEDVMNDEKSVIDVVDKAVSRFVGVVVLNCGDGNGRVLYDGCLLKSVIRDRAYLLIGERVDVVLLLNKGERN